MSTERYETLTEDVSFDFFKLIYASTAKYEGDWHSTLHAHQCTELFYVTANHGQFRVGNTFFPVRSDNLIIVNSNVEHTELPSEDSPLEYIVLGVSGGDFLLSKGGDNRYCVIDCSKDNQIIRDLMEQVLTEVKEKSPHYTITVDALLQLLSVHLLRNKKITVVQPLTNKTSIQCAAVKRYLDEHFKEDITLEKLARVAFLNKHDSAVSKRVYKYSFLLILNDRRIVTQFFFYDLFRFAKIRFVRNADFQIQFPLRSCGYICKTVICQYTVRNNYRLVVDRRQLCIKDLYLFYSSFDIFLCHDNIIAYGKRF